MDLVGLTELLAVAFLVVTMTGIGLRLGPPATSRRARVVPVARLAVASLVLVPLAGLAIVTVLPLPAAASFAVLALAVAPAGTVGPKLVQLAGGDLGLGVVVAFALSAIATLTVAPSLMLATRAAGLDAQVGAIDAAPIFGRLVLFQLAPLLAGMVVSARRAGLAERLIRPSSGLSNALLVAVVAVAVVDGWSEIAALGPLPFAAGLLLLGIADLLGWVAGGPEPSGRRTGLLITGQRSGALALLVAVGIGWPAAVAAVVALAVLSLVGNTIVAVAMARPLRGPAAAPDFGSA